MKPKCHFFSAGLTALSAQHRVNHNKQNGQIFGEIIKFSMWIIQQEFWQHKQVKNLPLEVPNQSQTLSRSWQHTIQISFILQVTLNYIISLFIYFFSETFGIVRNFMDVFALYMYISGQTLTSVGILTTQLPLETDECPHPD